MEYSPILYFKELKIISSTDIGLELNDYISPITLNKNNNFIIGNNNVYNDLIKMNENNIFFISTENQSEKLMIILIKLLNNDENILICYYEIKLKEIYNIKIFTDITTFIFNGMLGIGMTHYNYTLGPKNTYSSYFIIGDTSCSNINIQDNISIFNQINIYEIEIQNITFNINNNILAYIPIGIQIFTEFQNVGFNLYSKNQQNYIKANEIIFINDTIILKKSSSIEVKLGKYIIEYKPIISEPDFDDFANNFDLIEYYPNNLDYNSIYEPIFFSGKKAYISFILNECYETCKKCSYFGHGLNHQCDECSSNYPYYTLINNTFNCFDSCPENFISDEKIKFLCKRNETNIYEYCHAIDFFNGICRINYENIKNKEKIIENIINEIEDGSMNILLINVTNENKIDYIIKEKSELYQITSSFNQNNKQYNISTINLGPCEDILKYKYEINQNDTLIIFKIEYYIEGLYIPIIEYEIFHPITKEKLNLNYCDNVKINISIPVSIDEDNLLLYNPNSDYYNDRCFPYKAKNNTDIILDDRKKQYNKNNMSLCENNCEYIYYYKDIKKVVCECDIKTGFSLNNEIDIDFDKLINKFTDFKSNSNIGIIKCYYQLFTKEGLISNFGNYIILFISFVYIILTILFYLNKKVLFNDINQIIISKENIKIYNIKYKKIIKSKITNKIKTNNIIKYPPKKRNKHKLFKKTKMKMHLRHEISDKIDLIDNSNTNKKINLNKKEIIKSKTKNNFLYFELNSLEYQEALKYDKRTYCQYYYSLIKIKHYLFSITQQDYNSNFIKICLFLFNFVLCLTVNAFFFNDAALHKIYEDEGIFDFIYEIPQIIYTNLICFTINYLLKLLSLSQRDILRIKKEKSLHESKIKVQELYKCLNIRFICFFSLSFIFLFMFWYYLSCFCAVYRNTQFYLIEDTLISFGFSLLYPFVLNLLPGILRIPSLKSPGKDKECLFKVSKIVQLI